MIRRKPKRLTELVKNVVHAPDGLIIIGNFPVRFRYGHAFTPNEGASYGGGYHLMPDRDFRLGSLRRESSDALCKRRRRFWGLQLTDWTPAQGWEPRVCRACAARADRLQEITTEERRSA